MVLTINDFGECKLAVIIELTKYLKEGNNINPSLKRKPIQYCGVTFNILLVWLGIIEITHGFVCGFFF